VSSIPDAPQGSDPLAQAQQHLLRATEDVVQLSLAPLDPPDYYREFLGRVLEAIAAPAGVVWARTPEGHFQEQCGLNPGQFAPPAEGPGRRRHDELLRQAVQQAQPLFLPPARGPVPGEADGVGGALLMVPVLVELEVAAVLEVWLGADRAAPAIPGAVQFLVRMADQASVFLHRHQEQRCAPQQLWDQLDGFAQRAHASLDPTEVAYRVANEGRQLIACDRLSVALRPGRRATIEAVSGVEMIDRRSHLIRRMHRLCDRVLDWGERLVYRGVPDESLPPAVLRDLDGYLEASHCKALVVLPLRDEGGAARGGRDRPPPRPRVALLLECFEVRLPLDQLVARLETVSRHAGPALYNASKYRHIPLRFLWGPVSWLQAGLGGKGRAIAAAVTAAVVALVAALVLVPYPLKLDGKGQLLPRQRRWTYAPVEGQVVGFGAGVEPGALVTERQALVMLYDVQLESRVVQLDQEVAALRLDIQALNKQINAAQEADRLRLAAERDQKEAMLKRRAWEVSALRERTHSDSSSPGRFWVLSPVRGTILNWDFRETLTNRQVKPNEPLLRIGDKDDRWEVELKIPQKHMGQVIRAFAARPAGAELDVDFLPLSAPTQTFKGKLARARLAGEATPNREEANDPDPVVLASVRIDGADIAPSERLPPELLVAGTEVHVKVRCGDHPLGYSLFYGVYEFFYEKVLFFF
jgi:hypothetical protein